MTQSLLHGPDARSIHVGRWCPGGAGVLDVAEPATGRIAGAVGRATPDDVDRAARLAAHAQPGWAGLGFERRAAVLLAAAEALELHAAELADQLVRESGSVATKAQREVHHAAAECRHAAGMCAQARGAVHPSGDGATLSLTERVPVGVVAVITPWNAPLALAMRSVAPALALGNAVLLKPDPNTPIIGGSALVRVFEAAGLAPELLALLPGDGEVGEALCRHRDVRVVAFTGSTATGRRVAVTCAEHDTVPLLELGGNNATVVLAGADLDHAVACGARGSFGHAGQICMSTGRHLVHASLADAYRERLAERARSLRTGDPATQEVDVGPIINGTQHAHVTRLVDATLRAGARLVVGGGAEPPFFSPTVLDGVTADMPAWREEVFGPVAAVLAFDSEDEAVALANDSPYGLVAAVHDRDGQHALEVGRRLRVGMVHVNGPTIGDEPQIPFGGTGASGNAARFGGDANWDAYTETRWLAIHPETPPAPGPSAPSRDALAPSGKTA